ncbi:MAG: hypothetical protein ACLSHM_01450 [Vescimonas sp.]
MQQLFGMGAVQVESTVEIWWFIWSSWQDGKFYDRLGLESDHTTPSWACSCPIVTIPVRPGRNLAGIVEVAAMNNRQPRYGYNAARELARRNVTRKRAELARQAKEKQMGRSISASTSAAPT